VQSYDYNNRNGVRWVSWEEFVAMSGRLTEALAAHGVDAVVGVARAGLFPATAVACALRCEMYPVRVSRRVADEVVHARPVWKVPVADEVEGRVVAVIDEIADTGETLAIVAGQVLVKGAARVLTAAMVSHGHARPRPDVSVLTTDEFVIFPWDQRVFIDGRWQAHPEILAGLAAQRRAGGGFDGSDDPAR